jgi:hypothetical protein
MRQDIPWEDYSYLHKQQLEHNVSCPNKEICSGTLDISHSGNKIKGWGGGL